ncbi:MAG TPA: DNA polymerase IV [Bacteroidota bacterium]|nr:DNA polymerase IV [Bacteroidota bacterium]
MKKVVYFHVPERVHHIAHLDLDCFFVSVERIYDPSLIGQPVMVGGTPEGRGVVASASYEARKFGVRSAMPTRQALALCPRLICVRGSFERYGEISSKLRRRLQELAPVVEQASIDEFYLDFTGCEKLYHNDLPAMMHTLKRLVRDEFQLPCSIGLATNKMLSKIAASAAKPNGVCVVPPGSEAAFLAPMEIDVIPGIGAKTGERLRRAGYKTVADIQTKTIDTLRIHLGSMTEEMYRLACGGGAVMLTPEHDRKSIGREETFSRDRSGIASLEPELFRLTESVCGRLRSCGALARTVTLKLRYSDFTTVTRVESIEPTNDDTIVFRTARTLLERNYVSTRPVRLIGVSVSNLTDHAEPELSLFPVENKRQQIFDAVDKLRGKFGKEIIHVGGIAQEEEANPRRRPMGEKNARGKKT